MIEFKFKVANAASVHFAFAGLASAVKDWRPHIWPAVRDRAIRPWLKEQFTKEGALGEHGKWAALTEAYAARKAKKYPGRPILEASGRMKKDLLSPANKGEMMPRELGYGTDVEYARYHQEGTSRMPARRIFDPEESGARGTLKQRIRSAVAFGVSNHARALGFQVMGDEVDASEAAQIGREILSGGRGSLSQFFGGGSSVSEVI